MRDIVWLAVIGVLCLVAMVVSVPTVVDDLWAGLSAMLGL